MTFGFRKELGRGSHGVVYFATSLPEEPVKRKLVVKMMYFQKYQDRKEVKMRFRAGLQRTSRMHHRNVVALLGFCDEVDNLFLVYEYMENGSLYQHLQEDDGLLMGWEARMQCAIDVAQGLEYLHSQTDPPILHHDINSKSILFNNEMQTKIAGFGVSNPLHCCDCMAAAPSVQDMAGYLGSGFVAREVPSNKLDDVYSYGVVLLELITGRQAITEGVNLVTWCKDFIGEDDTPSNRLLLFDIVDRRISHSAVCGHELYDVVEIAKQCILEKPQFRLSMKDIVARLHNAIMKRSLDIYSKTANPISSPCLAVHPSVVCISHPRDRLSRYKIKDTTIVVQCTVGDKKISVRCKIWPTRENFGWNKVEARQNGALLWKTRLWWFNTEGNRDFIVGDEVKITAEWRITLRTSWRGLAINDPRRKQGPFRVDYLALKDEDGKPVVEYLGDRSPLPDPAVYTPSKVPVASSKVFSLPSCTSRHY